MVDAGWTYPGPTSTFAELTDHWAFYAQKADECWIDDERVTSNEGSFYGGWVTANVDRPVQGSTRHQPLVSVRSAPRAVPDDSAR